LIRERRKVDAMIRRGLTQERPADEPLPDLATVLERIGREIEDLLGGGGRGKTGQDGEGTAASPSPSSPGVPRPAPSLAERRAELDRLLRAELEAQGVTVSGREIARVVSSAVGKGIEWAG